jgi:hypothetical protein
MVVAILGLPVKLTGVSAITKSKLVPRSSEAAPDFVAKGHPDRLGRVMEILKAPKGRRLPPSPEQSAGGKTGSVQPVHCGIFYALFPRLIR